LVAQIDNLIDLKLTELIATGLPIRAEFQTACNYHASP